MAHGAKFWFLLETDSNLLASFILYTCQKWQLLMTSISISFISILNFWSIFFLSKIYCFFLFDKYVFFFHVYLLPSCQIFNLPMRVCSLEDELQSSIFQKISLFSPQQNVLIWNLDDDGCLEEMLRTGISQCSKSSYK